ncbi:L-threonine 3-dehydrogenase [Mobilicoccus caccae]|uniref:L-threonine 3-dehydrogenase n=1 Tax=Mobilicoccus caccae TaxID=1859295 RepID=A0ABQ6IMB8_9MICO|nr:L-threonine 3-dehydrogenase [Mobilicoccus caccae]GMA39057.1 L-threonine 3-dehydrogenase [Mobilicoccus caccae]
MRALAKTHAGPGLELIDRAEPECGPSDVKIKVLAAGLCGTDLHLEQWDDWAAGQVHPPMVIGHEFFGEIVEVGADVTSCSVGQKASGEGHVVCGMCRNCRAGRRQMCIAVDSVGVNRDGAFAEYVIVPDTNVWVQPDDMRPEVGAVFDPLGNATHTALMFPLVGEDVLITGAGPIGVMGAAIARHAGARYIVVTDVSDYRLDLARRAGADMVVNVANTRIHEAQTTLGMTEGFDVALEMSGNPAALRETIENMNHGGRIALLGLPKEAFAIDFGRVITHMLTIRGVYGREMFETWYAASAMMHTSELLRQTVGSVITHTVPLEEWPRAFEAARSGECGKVVLDIAGVL